MYIVTSPRSHIHINSYIYFYAYSSDFLLLYMKIWFSENNIMNGKI